MVTKADIAPMPTEQDRYDAWRRLYIGRMVKCGVDIEDATASFEAVGFTTENAGGFDINEDPEEAADAEMEYWDAE